MNKNKSMNKLLAFLCILPFTIQAGLDDLTLKAGPLVNWMDFEYGIKPLKEEVVNLQEAIYTQGAQENIKIWDATLTPLKKGNFSLSYDDKVIVLSDLNKQFSQYVKEFDQTNNLSSNNLNKMLDETLKNAHFFKQAFEYCFHQTNKVILDQSELKCLQNNIVELNRCAKNHKHLPSITVLTIEVMKEDFEKIINRNTTLRNNLISITQPRLAGLAFVTAAVGIGAYLVYKSQKQENDKDHQLLDA